MMMMACSRLDSGDARLGVKNIFSFSSSTDRSGFGLASARVHASDSTLDGRQ
jgi:hypothetical protein